MQVQSLRFASVRRPAAAKVKQMNQIDENEPIAERQSTPAVPRRWSWQGIARRSGSTTVVGIGLISLVLITGGALSSTPSKTSEDSPAPILNVATLRVEKRSGYDVLREFVGKVEARRRSNLSFELDGLVTAIHHDEGDSVAAGEVIATLDTQILRSRRSSIVAQLENARSTLDEMISGPRQEVIDAANWEVKRWEAQKRLAEVTRKRQQQLKTRNAGSNQDLDDAEFGQQVVDAQLNIARARLLELENGTRAEKIAAQSATVAQLQAELETIDINIAKASLIAPFEGTVGERSVDEGAIVASGAPVVELIERSELEVRVGVTEEGLRELRPGTRHEVLIHGRPYPAVARAIRPDRNQTTRTITAILRLDVKGVPVYVGDLARVQVEHHIQQPGFWVPLSALTESYRGLWACYVVDLANREPSMRRGDQDAVEFTPPTQGNPTQKSVGRKPNVTGRLELRELEVLHQTSDAAYVRGSLRSGDLVVSNGTQRLVPDQLVHPSTADSSENQPIVSRADRRPVAAKMSQQ